MVKLSENEIVEFNAVDSDGIYQEANEVSIHGHIDCEQTDELFINSQGGAFNFSLVADIDYNYSSGSSERIYPVKPADYNFTYSIEGETNLFTDISLNYPSLSFKTPQYSGGSTRIGHLYITVTPTNNSIKGSIKDRVLYVEQSPAW